MEDMNKAVLDIKINMINIRMLARLSGILLLSLPYEDLSSGGYPGFVVCWHWPALDDFISSVFGTASQQR
jgi:hypothetical protein